MGGEPQQTSLNSSTGYSDKAKGTGKPAYLEPNSNSMQKPIEGAIRVCFAETIEDRARIGCTVNQKHAAKTQKTSEHIEGG